MTAPTSDHLADALTAELATRDASAFAHAGARDGPRMRYCLRAADAAVDRSDRVAVAFDGERWLVRSGGDGHPGERLATALSEDGLAGPILTPAAIPHDAALYLEHAGYSLASTDVLARARAAKTASERDRIERAQAAASAGVRRAASLLDEAAVSDGRLAVDGAALTSDRLRIAVDEAVVAAGAFPAGNTRTESTATDGALRPGEPIVVRLAPREPGGYHGTLVRTFVVDGDGGGERRAHVAVTHAFKSARALLSTGPTSVTAVEADLEAEVRSFGFADADRVETNAAGIGLEASERPVDGADEVGPGSVVALEAAARVDDAWGRVADVLARTEDLATWLDAPSRSLDAAETRE